MLRDAHLGLNNYVFFLTIEYQQLCVRANVLINK